ncbi:hypothetical protein GCM10027589_42010 [Actinocorallia lasiicapitis]
MELPVLEPSLGRIRLIAVDGPSAAGKSTYARILAERIGAPLIGSDEFPVPWDGPPLAWWPRIAPLLDALARGETAVYRPYDWRSATLGPPKKVPVTDFLILEGVGAAWSGCPAAYRIWVDAPYELRRARALERDGAELLPQWEAWTAREAKHFAADPARPDLIVTPDSWRPPPARRRTRR